ncbi:MAG: pantetheine-phosphate adenylyltransferase [Hespellia sp.]|nr:pantetheine-phosphate adenylyltransferase [Hespellia sp.]
MLRGVYPGSFDPVTLGHLDIIRRSYNIVDELIVGVLNNNAKIPLFSVQERVKMLKEATKELPGIKIVPFEGLLIEFVRQMDAQLVIRGLRAITDFEYELQMSQTNHKLEPSVETIFLTTNVEYSYLSSSTVKEIAAFGGDTSQFVPEAVTLAFNQKKKESNKDE